MPKSKSVKIIVDTNLWISFIISKSFMKFDSIIYSGKIRLLFSAKLISKINATLLKPKFIKYFQQEAIQEMLLVFDPYIDFVKVKSEVRLCRDPKDDFLLELAKDGNADFLITGDIDLLTMDRFEKTRIVTISEFVKDRL